MFKRYNIDDLYLASISVMFPEPNIYEYEENIGGIFMVGMAGYGYLTILKKEGENYIDLQEPFRKITNDRDPKTTSYIIDYMEPLNKYYNQNGNKKYSKNKCIHIAERYYNEMHKNHLQEIKEEKNKKKVL